MSTRQHEDCRRFALLIPAYETGICGACGTEPAPSSATGFIPGEQPGTVFVDVDASEGQRFEAIGAEVVRITAKRDADLDRRIMARAAHLTEGGKER